MSFLSERDPDEDSSSNHQKQDEHGDTTAGRDQSVRTTGRGCRNPLVWRRCPPKNIPTVPSLWVAPKTNVRKSLAKKGHRGEKNAGGT